MDTELLLAAEIVLLVGNELVSFREMEERKLLELGLLLSEEETKLEVPKEVKGELEVFLLTADVAADDRVEFAVLERDDTIALEGTDVGITDVFPLGPIEEVFQSTLVVNDELPAAEDEVLRSGVAALVLLEELCVMLPSV